LSALGMRAEGLVDYLIDRVDGGRLGMTSGESTDRQFSLNG